MVIDKIKKRIEVNDDGTERVHRSDIPVGKIQITHFKWKIISKNYML